MGELPVFWIWKHAKILECFVKWMFTLTDVKSKITFQIMNKPKFKTIAFIVVSFTISVLSLFFLMYIKSSKLYDGFMIISFLYTLW